MYEISTNSSMENWNKSVWIIRPAHGISVLDIPPPRNSPTFIKEFLELDHPGEEVLGLLEDDESLELTEDLVVAKEGMYGRLGL